MPNNMPYDKWYWSDWFASTAILSIETKGVWHELLGRMFLADRTYYVEGTALELSRMVGCSEKQIINAVAELMRRNVADVTCNGEVTQCNDPVTDMLRIECRRYKKAYFERKSSAERVARFRRNRQCNGTVQTLSDLNQNQNHIYKEKSI